MEFNEKLQELRKQKGLTQEEFAAMLYVSRTAVSKWESGRGYPNIDSLKAIAKTLGVTVDELLSGEELLTLAQEDTRKQKTQVRDLVFGLLDCSVVLLFLLPFFGQEVNGRIEEVSLFFLTETALWLRCAYFVLVSGMAVWGILTLALQTCSHSFWVRCKSAVSFVLSMAALLLFILSTQPYAAMFLLFFLVIKTLMLVKGR